MDKLNVLDSAIAPLPMSMRQSIMRLPSALRDGIEEIRMRAGRPLSVTIGGREREITDAQGRTITVTSADISLVIDIVTRSSLHSAMDSMRHGFVTMQGGHRIGICATAVMKDGAVSMLRAISSISIRVARAVSGCSDSLMPRLLAGGVFLDTIVISPPGLGKTTLVRDIVRNLSDAGIRVGIADERGELAGMVEGRPRFFVGNRTDILDGAPKRIGMLMLLRTMSPDVICADEITAPADVDAVETCTNCGVKLLVTAHASTVEELYTRPVSRALMERGIFKRAVTIEMRSGTRMYHVTELSS